MESEKENDITSRRTMFISHEHENLMLDEMGFARSSLAPSTVEEQVREEEFVARMLDKLGFPVIARLPTTSEDQDEEDKFVVRIQERLGFFCTQPAGSPCETRPDTGFRQPAVAAPADRSRNQGTETAPEAMKKILLVDDHPVVSQRIGELLATTVPHAEMVTASSGEQGLALVAAHTFDLVLLDLHLPGCGGIDILKELRAARPGLPVIVISSLPESPYATLAHRAGARGFLTDRALVQELGRAVRTILGNRALEGV